MATSTVLPANAPIIGGPKNQGWYIFLGGLAGILFGNTPAVGPLILGVIAVACIYEAGMALQGK